jgi:hypothetical protein
MARLSETLASAPDTLNAGRPVLLSICLPTLERIDNTTTSPMQYVTVSGTDVFNEVTALDLYGRHQFHAMRSYLQASPVVRECSQFNLR